MADPSVEKSQQPDPSSAEPDPSLGDSEFDPSAKVEEVAHPYEADKANGAEETEKPIILQHNLTNHLVYRVPDIIIKRATKQVYNVISTGWLAPFWESFHENIDIRSSGFEWALIYSDVNRTDTPVTYNRTITEGLSIREGTETEHNFGISAQFKGLSFGLGGSRKAFTERETSRVVETSRTMTAAPRKETYLYQKSYGFQVDVWFWQYVPSASWSNHYSIGRNGDFRLITNTAKLNVLSEEFIQTHEPLTGQQAISADWVPALPGGPTTIRQYKDITRKANQQLASYGIRL